MNTESQNSAPKRRIFFRLFGVRKMKFSSPLHKRRTLLCHYILLVFGIISTVLIAQYGWQALLGGGDGAFGLFNFLMLTIIIWGIYTIGRRISYKAAIIILCLILYFVVTYGGFLWGITLPSILISYILITTVTSSCLGRTYGIWSAAVIAATILGFGLREAITQTIFPWIYAPLSVGDIIEYQLLLIVGFIIAWYGGKALEDSCKQEQDLSAQVQKYNTELETIVEERTQAWQQSQAQQLEAFHRFSEFGKVASGLVHDLMSPLSALNLQVQDIQKNDESVAKAMQTAQRIDEQLALLRNQLKPQETTTFHVSKVIHEALKLTQFRTRQLDVRIHTKIDESKTLSGNAFNFQRVLTNILNNAFDALSNVRNRAIHITDEVSANTYKLHIRDSGPGIHPSITNKIGHTQVTTKEKGCGLGILLIQEILKDFNGEISYHSTPDGTKATITISQP